MKQQPQVQELAPAGAAAPAGKPAGPSGAAPDPARRSFLRAAPRGALAGVTGSAGAAETPTVPAAAPPLEPKRGYHETEHIRRYYQTAAYW